jgi:Flp pilus assembly pilin Flp
MHEFITMIANPLRRLARDARGQDLIEYALMAGLLVLAAAAIMPNMATSISKIFSEITSVMHTTSS